MKHLIIKGSVIIFHREYSDKFFVPMQFFEPFIFLVDALVNIILLPFPVQSNMHNVYLRKLIKAQCKKRLKALDAAKKTQTC